MHLARSAVDSVKCTIVWSSDTHPPPPRRYQPSMVDYILAVRDPLQWHAANLAANRRHYTGLLPSLGPAALCAVAERVGVGLHFNPMVAAGGRGSGAIKVRGHSIHPSVGEAPSYISCALFNSLVTCITSVNAARLILEAGEMRQDVGDINISFRSVRAGTAYTHTGGIVIRPLFGGKQQLCQ